MKVGGETMSSTLRLSRNVLAMLIAIGMILMVMPAKRINALNGTGDTYYLFAKLAEDESGTYTAVDAYFGNDPTDAHDGCEFLTTFHSGYRENENFHVTDNNFFVLNDSQAFYNGKLGSSPDYLLLGSTLSFNDIKVSAKDDNAIFGIEQYGDQAYIVLTNYLFEHSADTYKYEVGANQTFNISTKSDGTGSVFETDDLTVNGKINIACNSFNIDKPNILRITDNGTLTAGEGSITGIGNALLEIGKGSTVTGGLVLYDVDGVTPVTVFDNAETFRYQGGKWIKNTNEGPFGDFGIFFNYEKEYITGEIEYSFNGKDWKHLDGEEKAQIYFENLGNERGFYVRFSFVPSPKDDSLIKVNGVVPEIREAANYTRIFCVLRNGDVWEGKYDIDFLLNYESGVYFVNETGSDLSIKYGFSKDALTSDPEYGSIPASALGNNSGLYFKIDSSLAYLQTGICCVTNKNDNRDFRPEGDDVYYLEKGSGWDNVFFVHVRQQEAGIMLDDRGGEISNFTYKLDSGNPVAVDGNFISKETFKNSNSITISYSIADSFNVGDVHIKYENKVEMENGRHFSFDPEHPDTFTIFKNGNWGDYYDVQFVSEQQQPQETFNIEFPDSTDVVRNIEYTTDDPNSSTANWRPATRDENGGRYYIDAEKQWTAINVRFVPCDHVNDVDVRFESLAQSGAEPVEINGITVNNNMFTLVKPYEGENPDWAYGYIVTITAKNNTPTPTPDPNSDILEKVEGHGFAYYTNKTSFDEKAADLKNCVATEIYCYFTVSQTHDYPTFADLLNNLNCTSTAVQAADDEVGLPYLRFALTQGSLTTEFKVYILDSATKFIIKTCVDKRNVDDPKDDAYVYTVVEPGEYSNGIANQLTVRMNYLEQPTVFGNGVSTINSETNNEGNIVLHVTQDNSNIDLHFADTPEHELFPTNSVGKINTYLTVEKYEIKTLNAAIAGTKLLITGTTSGSKTGDPVYVAVYKDAEKIASGLFSAGSDQSHSFSGEISIAGHGITNPSQIRVYASDREDGVMVTGTVEVAAVVAGYNIRLDGYVGVSYWLTLSSAVEELEPSVTFAYDSQVNELKSQTVAFADSSVVTVGNVSYRVYSCKVASPEMTCPISATLTYGNTSVALETRTARQIVKNYADNQGNSELLKGLARKILNYGYYSQKYFRPDLTLNNEDDAGLDPIPSNLEGPAIPQQLPEGIQYSSTGVVFNSGNKIKFYFTIDSGVTPVITLDGGNANLVASGQRYYVYLDQISIAELGRNIVVSINGECTFTYSVLNYIALVRDSDKVDENAKKVVQALYMYYLAAEAYGTSTEA